MMPPRTMRSCWSQKSFGDTDSLPRNGSKMSSATHPSRAARTADLLGHTVEYLVREQNGRVLPQ